MIAVSCSEKGLDLPIIDFPVEFINILFLTHEIASTTIVICLLRVAIIFLASLLQTFSFLLGSGVCQYFTLYNVFTCTVTKGSSSCMTFDCKVSGFSDLMTSWPKTTVSLSTNGSLATLLIG